MSWGISRCTIRRDRCINPSGARTEIRTFIDPKTEDPARTMLGHIIRQELNELEMRK
jgi:hypothetical protein